jgi:hypothetical protein
MVFFANAGHTLPNSAPYGGSLAVVKQLPHSFLARAETRRSSHCPFPWTGRGGGKGSGENLRFSPSRLEGAGGLPPFAGGAPDGRSLRDSGWKPPPHP